MLVRTYVTRDENDDEIIVARRRHVTRRAVTPRTFTARANLLARSRGASFIKLGR